MFVQRKTTLSRRASGSVAAIIPAMLPAMLVAGLASPGVAVAQASLHLRGVIVESNLRSTDHPPMVLRQDNGSPVTVELAINARGTRVDASTLRAIAPPRHARAIVEHAPDGTLHARVVLLFPDNFSDGPDGDTPWDRPASSRCIQGTVAAAVPSGSAIAMALRYGDTQSTIMADEATQVAEIGSAYGGYYVPGDAVFIAATRQRDGRITAGRVFFGKNGFVPPL
jgi:hypothetical protein